MKMDFIKSIDNNFSSLKISDKKQTFKLNESKNFFRNSLNNLKNNSEEKLKCKNKDKDDYVKEALEFLNSLVNAQNSKVNADKIDNSKEIDINISVKKSYEKIKLDGDPSKQDLLKEGKLLEALKNLTKEIQMLLVGQKAGLNKEDLLKKLKGMENSLNINNKDILDLIKNRLDNLGESINKFGLKIDSNEIKGLLEKLQTTEKLMKNLIEKQIKINKDVLNKDEKKSFENLLKNIDDKFSDSAVKNLREASVEENSSKDILQSKEEKILSDIIKGKQLNNKHNNGLFYGVAQKNNDNNLKIESMGSIKITPQNPIDGVIKTVKYMNINNLQELTVKINPVELGEVTIKLTMGSDGMKASILANNKDTYNLLNANINDLKNSLNNQNIKVIDVFINLNNNNEDTSSFQNQYNEANLNNNENRNSNQRKENEKFVTSNQDVNEIKVDEEKEVSLINAFA